MAFRPQYPPRDDELVFDHVDAYVGGRAKARRLHLNKTIGDLSDEIGLMPSRLEAFENGTGRLGPMDLRALARALGVRIHYFFEQNAQSQCPEVMH